MIKGEGIQQGWNPAQMVSVAAELANDGQIGDDTDRLAEAGRLFEEAAVAMAHKSSPRRGSINDSVIRSLVAFQAAGLPEEVVRGGNHLMREASSFLSVSVKTKMERLRRKARREVRTIYSVR